MNVRLLTVLALTACGGTTDQPRPTLFGGDRPAELKVPIALEDGKLYPLLVVLHGYSANGFAQTAVFGVGGLPAAGEALLIAPDGTADSTGRQFWNADPACCDFEHKNPDDVGYLGGLIDDISAAWPIDKNAVYLLGHSNGGFMAYRMACERADVVTAIVSLAGLASSDPATCHPTRSVNVLHIHGTADATVPFDAGGTGIGNVGAEGSVRQWDQLDGCATTRTAGATIDLDTSVAGPETHESSSDGCPAHVGVDLWTLEGSGHIPLFGANFVGPVMEWFTAHKRS